jgi:excisionase family DNA binding protein
MSSFKHATGIHSRDSEFHQLLTKEELAKRLKLTKRGVECLVARRVIPVIRISRRCVRFRYEDVMAALERLTVKVLGL